MSQAGILNVGSLPPPPGSVVTLTGDIGGAASPDGAGNINVVTNKATLLGGRTFYFFESANTLNLTITDGISNTLVGSQSGGSALVTGIRNTGFGANTLNSLVSGEFNTAISYGALASLTTTSANVAIGYLTLNSLIDGGDNVAVGSSVLSLSVHDSNNTGVGDSALLVLNGGISNTAIGKNALSSLETGSGNTSLGYIAGSNYNAAESYNVSIGYGVIGTLGESNVIRIADKTSTQPASKCFIGGINGNTVSNPLLVTIDSVTGQLGVSPSGGTTIDSIAVDTTTGAGTNPVLPTAAGLVTFTGGQYATGTFGTRVITINSTAANTLAVEAQISSAAAATNINLNGICHHDSARFTVNASGFVSLVGAGMTWIDQGASTTILSNTGYFATAAVTLTLPVAPSQGDTIPIICDTASSVVIQASAGQTIRNNSGVSSVAGTLTNSARGDSIRLIYRAATTSWESESSQGGWVPA